MSSDKTAGYLEALADMFEILTRLHHDEAKYDRHLIDRIWGELKLLESKKRDTYST